MRRAPPPPPDAAPRTANSIRLLIGGVGFLLLWVILLTGWTLWETREATRLQASQSSDNVASVIADEIEHTISLYDLSLQGVADDLRLPRLDRLTPELRNQGLFDHSASGRNLGEIMVLDQTGRVTIASRHAAPPNLNFADREFFRVQRDKPNQGLYIGTPFKDATTGVWAVPISRRIAGPYGSFAGVVFGTLRLDFFRELFARIDTGAAGSIVLFRADGRLVYRTPFDERLIGRDFADSSVFRNRGAAAVGVFTQTSDVDGVKRFYAYRELGRLPLVLTVGLATDTMLAQWREKAIWIGIEIAALAAIITLLGSALIGELQRRGKAELTALESEKRYRFLAEHSGDMIVRFDPRTQEHTYVSSACRHLYGYEPEEALAIKADQIIHPDDFPGVCEALTRLERDADHSPIVYRGRRKDGSYVWVEASLTRSQDPDSGKGEIISVVRDIEERVRYEAALRNAKEEADSANRSKSLFLATMSHELRTPLNAIIGFAELMQGEVMGPIGNEHYRSYISDIHLSGSHLLQLINDILDLTKAEAGMLELNEDVIDLGAAIRAVIRVSSAPIEKAGLTLTLDLPSDLPLLRADDRKARQVFFNLIGNSLKFTRPGGFIRILGECDPQRGVRITVADTGIGIAPDDLGRVLEPFVQVDSSLSRQHHGTGLGLPAVKAIMELHGGSVELRSTLGQGTEVTVVFPPERVVMSVRCDEPTRSAA